MSYETAVCYLQSACNGDQLYDIYLIYGKLLLLLSTWSALNAACPRSTSTATRPRMALSIVLNKNGSSSFWSLYNTHVAILRPDSLRAMGISAMTELHILAHKRNTNMVLFDVVINSSEILEFHDICLTLGPCKSAASSVGGVVKAHIQTISGV